MEIKKATSYEIDGQKFGSHEEAKRYVMSQEMKEIIINVFDEQKVPYSLDIIQAFVDNFENIYNQVDARRKELFPRNRKGKG